MGRWTAFSRLILRCKRSITTLTLLFHYWLEDYGERGPKGENVFPSRAVFWQVEIDAYNRQYAFDPSSVQKISSYPKNATNAASITRKWVAGINNSGDFIYLKIALKNEKLTRSEAEKLVDGFE